MSITYTSDQERDVDAVKDLADRYNFEVAAFNYAMLAFIFENFLQLVDFKFGFQQHLHDAFGCLEYS